MTRTMHTPAATFSHILHSVLYCSQLLIMSTADSEQYSKRRKCTATSSISSSPPLIRLTDALLIHTASFLSIIDATHLKFTHTSINTIIKQSTPHIDDVYIHHPQRFHDAYPNIHTINVTSASLMQWQVHALLLLSNKHTIHINAYNVDTPYIIIPHTTFAYITNIQRLTLRCITLPSDAFQHTHFASLTALTLYKVTLQREHAVCLPALRELHVQCHENVLDTDVLDTLKGICIDI